MLRSEHPMLKQKKEWKGKKKHTERERYLDPYSAAVCSAGEGTSRRLCWGQAAPSLPLIEEQVSVPASRRADMKNWLKHGWRGRLTPRNVVQAAGEERGQG